LNNPEPIQPAIQESPLLAGLNPQQREAVLASEGAVLILAGAGSGKTRVITHRIAHLVLDKGVSSERILAVTFTNKAAGEMKARTEALLPGQSVKSWISTFHSLCVRILRREAGAAGLPRDFVIYDEEDQRQAVREALRALDLPEKVHPPRRILARISAAKNAGRGIEAAGGSGGTGGSPPLDERARIDSARANDDRRKQLDGKRNRDIFPVLFGARWPTRSCGATGTRRKGLS